MHIGWRITHRPMNPSPIRKPMVLYAASGSGCKPWPAGANVHSDGEATPRRRGGDGEATPRRRGGDGEATPRRRRGDAEATGRRPLVRGGRALRSIRQGRAICKRDHFSVGVGPRGEKRQGPQDHTARACDWQKRAFCVGVGGGRRINGKALRMTRRGRAMCKSERVGWEWGPAVRKKRQGPQDHTAGTSDLQKGTFCVGVGGWRRIGRRKRQGPQDHTAGASDVRK